MATPKTHDWQHDGEYCHHRHQDEEGAAARSVCEGMYAEKEDEKLRLKEALRAVYALAGIVLSWSPGKKALALPDEGHNVGNNRL